ncbi:MAG TPA: fibronectin type III domain-containing protein [Jatrophihabitans sp.]|jgi:hypothetical protein|uniref:fibronectin type III domain-containing protein n=1 Tax=Jatrophihabitans sp. TaxID=1932789 RepID=UPI002E059E04|nr:fibronectin type III domain-containing protein [Jatrophihabitans sp.]
MADSVLPVRRCVVAIIALLAGVTVLAIPRTAGGAIPPSTPSQPGPITVTGIASNSAALSWGASADVLGIEGYRIYRQGPGASSASLIATTDGGITHYSATNLFANSSYTFQVVALDVAANTSPAQTTTFSTLTDANTTPPAAPADPSVAAHTFSDTRVDVQWGGSPTADVAGYKVLRDGIVVAEVDLPGGLRYSDTGLNPGTYYKYTIEAIDSAGLISAPTNFKAPAGTTTLATGTATIARGPYLSNVSGTSAVVSWWTNIATPGVVTYGPGSPSTTVTDPAGTVQHHSVTLTGLNPGSTYQYTVGGGPLASSAATIRTAAPVGTAFSFAAIGDFGGASPGETQNAANIATAGTSFVQTLGDNIYASSGLPDPDFTNVYSDYDARFFKLFGPVVRNQALFPANGNQEYYSNGAFWATFPMPGTNHSWYSYDWGNAHITVIDSEVAFDPSSPQYAFIKQDLSAHQNATWRIVIMQRPPYSSTSAAASSNKADAYLVPLFESQHVALVLSGNSHNYERSYPITGGQAASGGVTYVVSGGGGNGHNPFTIAAPAWSAARSDTRYEYVKVSVSPAALRVDAIDAPTNTVFDTATIAAPPTVPGAPTIGTASPLNPASALVQWTAPADNGRSPITTYTATAAPGGRTCTTTGATSCTFTGLTPNTQYTFTVVATNAVGPSAASAASAPITTPRIPTRLLITSSPTAGVGGAAITVTGMLTRSDTGAALVNHVVQLEYRPLGSTGAFATLPAAARTSSAGVVSFRVGLGRSTQYRLFAPTDPWDFYAFSQLRNVYAVHAISIAPSPRATTLHAVFRIYGRVSPASWGVRIYLQSKVGTTWSTRAWTTVNSSSIYIFSIIAPARGTLPYRTLIVGNSYFATSYSPYTLVSVR